MATTEQATGAAEVARGYFGALGQRDRNAQREWYHADMRGQIYGVVEPTGRVLDHRGYTNAVVERLRSMGYCAMDQLEEIAVKKSNSFNEQYNIWTSGGYVRRAYITTCFPAQF